MIFVDTSAIVAMLRSEPEAPIFAAKLEAASDLVSAPHVILEASMRLSTLLKMSPTLADDLVTRLFREACVEVVPITEETAHAAVLAFEQYGRGRGQKASLNFGDCLSYACAKAYGATLLFKGDDFAQTDIAKA